MQVEEKDDEIDDLNNRNKELENQIMELRKELLILQNNVFQDIII